MLIYLLQSWMEKPLGENMLNEFGSLCHEECFP